MSGNSLLSVLIRKPDLGTFKTEIKQSLKVGNVSARALVLRMSIGSSDNLPSGDQPVC